MAKALAEAGADIVSVQRGENTAELEACISHAGRDLLTVSLDIAREAAAEQAGEAALARLGHVDILVNNAGVHRRAPAFDSRIEDWDPVINVTLRAVFLFCQVFGRQMVQQGRGKIINIASLLSVQGGITIPAYTASKHAIAGLTKALCNEWASQGVNVNAIAPGYMDTDLNVALRANPQRERQISERIPAGRWGTPEDMAGAGGFLAAAPSGYLLGHMAAGDGGSVPRSIQGGGILQRPRGGG